MIDLQKSYFLMYLSISGVQAKPSLFTGDISTQTVNEVVNDVFQDASENISDFLDDPDYVPPV